LTVWITGARCTILKVSILIAGVGTKTTPVTVGHPPSDAKTPPPPSCESPPPLGSPSEVSSRRPRSEMFEQSGPSRNIPVIELSSSSDEEGFFADIARDADFTKRLFGDLYRDLLGLPGDGKVIVISDSDEEKEVREETYADAEVAPPTVVKSLTPASSAADSDEDLGKMQDGNSDDLAPA
jgi:hypothetical protein